jgi:hypothetical protein
LSAPDAIKDLVSNKLQRVGDGQTKVLASSRPPCER